MVFRALTVMFGAAAVGGLGFAIYDAESDGPREHPVHVIPLSGGAELAEAELSGLAWWADDLILLPQYPSRFPTDGASGSLFRVPRRAIERFLDRSAAGPLEVERVPFEAGPVADLIDGFDGFEAIAFHGDTVFLAVEAQMDEATYGVLVKGRIADGRITVDEHRTVDLPSQVDLDNIAYEALVVSDERVFAFFEANGVCNQAPEVHEFDLDLVPAEDVGFDPLEYRLTDATSLDARGRFWAANYQWAGTPWATGNCPLTRRFGAGASHREGDTVERLVEFELRGNEVVWTGREPIQLELLGRDQGRNWEGVERLSGRGFLIVTDEHPSSLFGFVEYPGV